MTFLPNGVLMKSIKLGFDWAQFVPNKNGMGKPQSKLASAGESPDSSASPQSSSSPEKTQGRNFCFVFVCALSECDLTLT